MVKKVKVVYMVLVSINCPGVGVTTESEVTAGVEEAAGKRVYPSDPSLVSRLEFKGSISVAIRELVISKVVKSV